jgi:hypothetical protein
MIRARGGFPAAILGAVFAVGCGSSDSGPNTPTGPTFTQVTQEVITNSACGGPFCHGAGSASFTLGSTLYSELVGQKASGTSCGTSGLIRVVAGDPAHSLLYLKLQFKPPCGDGMPATGPLDVSKVEMVRQWIAAGAKDD